MLCVHQRHFAAQDGPKADFCGPQAVVGVFEIGVKIRTQASHCIQHVAAQIGHCEDDALHLAVVPVLAQILLERSNLLAPERVGKDVGPGMQQPAIG
jgi:hypothetical protein